MGDTVKILSSRSDHIEEIKNMIGKELKVLKTKEFPDKRLGYLIPDKNNYLWMFARDEIKLVDKKKGRGRPVGSKNKNSQRKGVKEL